MATGTETLTRSLRMLGVLGADQSPVAFMESLGLETLIDMLDGLPDMFSGPRLFDQSVVGGATIGGNVRLLADQVGAATVTLPATPNDGWRVQVVGGGGGAVTLGRNGKKIVGSAADYAVPSNTAHLMFRADLQDWRLITIAALTDPLPYPAAFDEHMATGLAIALAPHYDQPIKPEVAQKWGEGMALLAQRYAPRRRMYGTEKRFGDAT